MDEVKENRKIVNIIINDLKNSKNDIITNKIKLSRINNEDIIIRKDENIFFSIKEDYSYIPLTKNIWNIFYNNYGGDIILEKKGFANNGEIYVEIDYKRVDCFFTLFETKDTIYHYCFILDDFIEYENFIKFLKGNKPINTARFLLGIFDIQITAHNTPEKFKNIINDVDKLINNYDLTIYFFGSFKFNDSASDNIQNIKNNKNNLYLSYKHKNKQINDEVKNYKNTHTNIHQYY